MKKSKKNLKEIDIPIFVKLIIKEIYKILLILLLPIVISVFLINNENKNYSVSAKISKRDAISMENFRSFNALIDAYYDSNLNYKFPIGFTLDNKGSLKKIDNDYFFNYFKYYTHNITKKFLNEVSSDSQKKLINFRKVLGTTSYKDNKPLGNIDIKSENIENKNEWLSFINTLEKKTIDQFRKDLKNSFEISKLIENNNNLYLLENIESNIKNIEFELREVTAKLNELTESNKDLIDKRFSYQEKLKIDLYNYKLNKNHILQKDTFLNYIEERLFKTPIFSEDFYLVQITEIKLSQYPSEVKKFIIIIFALSFLIIFIYLLLKYNKKFN